MRAVFLKTTLFIFGKLQVSAAALPEKDPLELPTKTCVFLHFSFQTCGPLFQTFWFLS
jgi:hypothetical protein